MAETESVVTDPAEPTESAAGVASPEPKKGEDTEHPVPAQPAGDAAPAAADEDAAESQDGPVSDARTAADASDDAHADSDDTPVADALDDAVDGEPVDEVASEAGAAPAVGADDATHADTDPSADEPGGEPTPSETSAASDSAPEPVSAVAAQNAGATADPPAPAAATSRHALPRVVLTAEAPVGKDSVEMVQARGLAQAGNYVMLTAPAETAEITTSVSIERDGILRVLGVPVDAEAAAEISVARSEVAALAGPGLVIGMRRKFARRRLAAVRKDVWESAAADPGWSARCGSAYQPYVDAFAPVAQSPVGQAGGIDAKAAAPEGVVLGIGPTNMAGQAHEWARAVQANLAGPRAETYTLSSGNTFGFPTDRSISTDDWLSRTWQLRQLAYILDHFSHVLAECAMPPFGRLNGPWANFDLAELTAAGVATALVFHGSEIRNPAAHRERMAFSPFDPDHELTRALQSKVDRLGPVVRAMDVPKFVSTPDLLADVPDAEWLPVVVDPALWASDRKPLERKRPVVVHAPSSPFTKGTALIEPIVEEMHDAGLIEYRRIKGVGQAEMPALLADADIVLDQFVFGAYGVMSAQAMAAGRVTVCYVADEVAEHLPADLPLANADPETLPDVLHHILEERDKAAEAAARGPAYVRENHDGTRSARVLAGFLGIEP